MPAACREDELKASGRRRQAKFAPLEIQSERPSQSEKPFVRYYERMKQKHGLAKSKSIIGHKYAIAVYHMLKNKKEFDENKFIGG